jgi:uncharacterized protein (DUF2236 family)
MPIPTSPESYDRRRECHESHARLLRRAPIIGLLMAHTSGYFPPGTSRLREVHEERAVGLMYGQRALCIGALAPLNYIGTSEHTSGRQTPFKRLVRTAKAFEAVIMGSRAEADTVLAAVHSKHLRVFGVLPEAAGPYPAGTPYNALDRALMLWTIAVMMDSAEHLYDLLVRRLKGDEREHLWRDYVRFGELFGMPRAAAPATYPGFRQYYEQLLSGDSLWLTDEARYMGRATAFEIPMPASAQPVKRLHDLIMLGSLPPRVRDVYRLKWTPAHALAFTAATASVRAARRALPASSARGRNTRTFDLVAETEARRIAEGRPTPQLEPLAPRAVSPQAPVREVDVGFKVDI